MSITATDPRRIHRALLALAGPDTLALTRPLTAADYQRIEQILTEHAPTHLQVLDALNADGSVRDQTVFAALVAGAGQDTSR